MSILDWLKNLFTTKETVIEINKNESKLLDPNAAELIDLVMLKSELEHKNMVRLKAKSLRVKKINTSVLRLILDVAADMCVYSNSITGFRMQKPMPELRHRLDPAYNAIAKIITKIEGIHIEGKDLSGLNIDLKISSGWLRVSVLHKDHNTIQPYRLSIYPWDGNTYSLRLLRMPMPAETDRLEYVVRQSTML